MKGRVLIVDDEEGIRFTLCRFLSEEGYEASEAVDYDEALRIVSSAEYDVVFADILLGGSTGIDLLREITRRGINCPVVMITGAPDIETASEAVRLGAFDYIPKPVTKTTIIRVAEVALKNKRLADEKEKYRSHLEAVFSSVRDAIITTDGELKVVSLNQAAENVFGASRDSIGKPVGAVTKPCGQECARALEEALKGKRPVEAYRLRCKRDDGKGQLVNLTASPLMDGSGGVFGALLVARDITRMARLEQSQHGRDEFHGIIGRSEEMQKVYSLIEDLADVNSTVLITGESGTGKELVAEALHYCGSRDNKPLVKVNCSALSDNLLESELFGHVKGAFTGAIKDKQGRFELADGGTIFLDEIGDISPLMQLRLLRVLQEKEFERVGDSRPIKVDVRIAAATNQDLAGKVGSGEFREDLFYRLNVIDIHLPPLRDKPGDIPLLVEHFVAEFNEQMGKDIESVSPEVLKIFMRHSWPGNVRQLAHVLEYSFVRCRGKYISPEDLPAGISEDVDKEAPPEAEIQPRDAEAILQALEKTAWNKAKAARLLGVSRQTLYRKMKEAGLKQDETD